MTGPKENENPISFQIENFKVGVVILHFPWKKQKKKKKNNKEKFVILPKSWNKKKKTQEKKNLKK